MATIQLTDDSDSGVVYVRGECIRVMTGPYAFDNGSDKLNAPKYRDLALGERVMVRILDTPDNVEKVLDEMRDASATSKP